MVDALRLEFNLRVAVIVAVPAFTPEVLPTVSTVATERSLEDQVIPTTSSTADVPFEYLPVGINDMGVPMVMVGFAGAIVIEVRETTAAVVEPAPQPANANTAKDANNKLNILYMIAFIF